MIIKCKECGTSIEIDESLYENSIGATTICPLCGEEFSFTIKRVEKRKEKEDRGDFGNSGEFDTSFCSKCGRKLGKDEVFCPHCGNRISTIPLPPPPSPLEFTPRQKQETSHPEIVQVRRTSSTHTTGGGKYYLIVLLVIIAIIGSGLMFLFLVTGLDDQNKEQGKNMVEEIPQERIIYQSSVNVKNCFIVISKKSLSLKVYEGSNMDTTLVAVFPACLSKNKGQKYTAGDYRTPECSMDNPFRVTQITDASTWRYDFGDGRGSILAYGHWFIRLNSEFSGIGIMGSTNNEQSVPGRESSGSIRLKDDDLDFLKEHYVFEGMKVIIKGEGEGLYDFEKRCSR